MIWSKLIKEIATEALIETFARSSRSVGGTLLLTKPSYDREVYIRCGRKYNSSDDKCYDLYPKLFAERKRKKATEEASSYSYQRPSSGSIKF